MDSQTKYGIVSRGEASLYIRLPNPASLDYRECIWDHAAGLIVVEEAGGTVTDANGTPLNFLTGKRMHENRGIVATNGKLHQHVLKALANRNN
jgi:3'(2'), 5'-bisphosphate nucleotidase